MPDPSMLSTVLWPMLALLAVSVPVAALLARVGWPGVLGGAIAGLLLGPTVLGRVAPDWHRALLTGGLAETRELRERETEFREELEVLEATGITPVAITELRARQDAERQKLERWRAAAEARHQLSLSVAMLAVVLPLVALAAGMDQMRPRPWLPRRAVFVLLPLLAAVAWLAPRGWTAVVLACGVGGLALGRAAAGIGGEVFKRAATGVLAPLAAAWVAAGFDWLDVALPRGNWLALAILLALITRFAANPLTRSFELVLALLFALWAAMRADSRIGAVSPALACWIVVTGVVAGRLLAVLTARREANSQRAGS